jgi:dienelactone hydrolase
VTAPSPSGREPHGPLYLAVPGGHTAFAWLHPATAAPTGVGVLFCPPFGYDHICAYRSLRAWARELSADGHAALRLDLPGTGDSADGVDDDELLTAWTASLDAGARLLREQPGCRRVVAIGLGLGGLLALRAAADDAPVDDFVLWGVPARGRTLVRELRAFARLGRAQADGAATGGTGLTLAPEGGVEAGGFLLVPGAVTALEALDLTGLELTGPGDRRALVLGRDDLRPDPRLERALRDAGVPLAGDPGEGWAAMLDSPHLAHVPAKTIAAVGAWLAAEPVRASGVAAGAPPAVAETLELPGPGDGPVVRERPLWLAVPGGNAFGVLAEPAGEAHPAGLCGILLNVGAERRIGANRMWVDVARSWAAQGVPTLRVDLPGMGDADGPDDLSHLPSAGLYEPQYGEATGALLDALEAAGLPGRFVVSGICSGAYWSFQVAAADPRVVAALPLNSRLLRYDARLLQEADPASRPPSADSPVATARRRARAWIQTPGAEPLLKQLRRPLAAWVIRRVWGARTRGDELDTTLDEMRDRGQTVSLLFTEGEALFRELRREGRLDRAQGRWPNLRVEVLPSTTEAHTFQLVQLQAMALERLDRMLRAELERAAAPLSGSPAGVRPGSAR